MNESELRQGHYRKILFCTDFSENAKFAFDFAVDAAIRNVGCTLCLLHVIPEPDAQFWKGYIYEVGDMDAKARADIDHAIDADYRPLGLADARHLREQRGHVRVRSHAQEQDVEAWKAARRCGARA